MITSNLENDFIRERNEALFSLDRNRIEAYMLEYGEEGIADEPDEVFWLAVYKAVCQIPSAPSAVINKSKKLYEDALLEHLMAQGAHIYYR